MKKIISLVLILALSASLLISCSNAKYKDDLAVSDVANVIAESVKVDGGYKTLSDDYLSFYFELPNGVSEKTVVQSIKEQEITEFGVFKTDSKNVKTLKSAIEQYLEEQKAILVPQVNMYAPEEAPKIEKATVKVFGNYVVYLIMDKDTQDTAYDAVTNLLKK